MSILALTQTIHIAHAPQRRPAKRAAQPMLPGMEPEQKEQKVTNRQIAEVLAGVADLLEAQNSNPYRIQAYRNAARGVLDLKESAFTILERGERLPIPGLGERLRTHISDLVAHGAMTFQTGLYMQKLPTGVRILMTLDHIGPYTAIRLFEELGIDSPEKLWRASSQQRIRKLPGFGERSEDRLKQVAYQFLKKRKQRELDGVA